MLFSIRRRAIVYAVLALAVVASGAKPAHGQDDLRSRRERVATYSAAEKRELLAKQQRFDALAAGEQQRLRDLHTAVQSQSDTEQLRSVMENYVEWLGTLTSKERARVQDRNLTTEQRMQRIADLHQRHGDQALQAVGLTKADAAAVLNWFTTSLEANPSLSAALRSDRSGRSGDERSGRPDSSRDRDRRRDRQAESADEMRQTMRLRMEALNQLDRVLEQLPTSSLVDQLSQPARDKFLAHDNQKQLLESWIHQALRSQFRPPRVSRETLFQWMRRSLPEERQAQLERLPPNELEAELRRLHAKAFWLRRRPPRGRRDGRDGRRSRPYSDGRRDPRSDPAADGPPPPLDRPPPP